MVQPKMLREYQVDALSLARESFAAGMRRLLLVLPTGGGKTFMAAHIMRSAVSKGNRAVFIAPLKILVNQCSERLTREGIEHGVIMADDSRKNPDAPVQVASIWTLARRGSEQYDLAIIDEAHLSVSDSYLKALDEIKARATLGLTATPCRLNGRGLGDLYDAMVQVGSVADLTSQGFLAPCRAFSVPGANTSSLHIRAGDYAPGEAEMVMYRSAITGNIIEHWQRLAAGRKTVLFATTKRHAQHCKAEFERAGIGSGFVHSGTPAQEAAETFARWRDGDIDVLCNVNIVSMGFDFPAISCVIDAAPTLSTARFLQRCGRASRGLDGKRDYLLLDHAGNVLLHGLPTADREWHLDSGLNVRRKSSEALGIRCEKCFAVFIGEVCTECGTAAPKKARRDIEVIDRALTEVDAYSLPQQIVEARKFYRAMLAVASKKRTKSGRRYNAHGWAWHQVEAKFGKETALSAIHKRHEK